jgi:hypothetical protein
MHLRIFAAATAAMLLLVPVHAQQSHWASADDKTAEYIIDMEPPVCLRTISKARQRKKC